MSQMNAIPERDQVSVEETWNLTDLSLIHISEPTRP